MYSLEILCMLFLLMACSPNLKTVEHTTDQHELAKIAVEATDNNVRWAAFEKLSDPILVAETKPWVKPEWTRQVTDQELLARIAVKARDEDVRRTAASELSDQDLLAKLENENVDIRSAALKSLTSQIEAKEALLAKIARESKWLEIRVEAINHLTNQIPLRRLAQEDPQAAIRQSAVRGIKDDEFLVQLLAAEPSAEVRNTIINTLREESSLRKVALTADHGRDRKHALERLGVPDSEANEAMLRKVAELLNNASQHQGLLALALEGKLDLARAAAAQRLREPAELERAALLSRDREVLKIVLAELESRSMLKQIAAAASDPAMRLAAAQKAEIKSWDEIFNTATAKGADAEILGNALAAVSLFSAKQPEAVNGVQQASLNLIRRGDEKRIPEMVDLLEGYGDTTLAEDYLNSGQPDLASAARRWATAHGYSILVGGGSHRARWGSDR